MKVAKLIKQLEQFPGDMEVVLCDGNRFAYEATGEPSNDGLYYEFEISADSEIFFKHSDEDQEHPIPTLVISFETDYADIMAEIKELGARNAAEGKIIRSFEKLTQLQSDFGYQQGEINPVALLGLFGEAGEVLNECLFYNNNKGLVPMKLMNLLHVATSIGALVDDKKKQLRKKPVPGMAVGMLKEDYENFDKELADVLYYLNLLAFNRGHDLAYYAQLSVDKVLEKNLAGRGYSVNGKEVDAKFPPRGSDLMVKQEIDDYLRSPNPVVTENPLDLEVCEAAQFDGSEFKPVEKLSLDDTVTMANGVQIDWRDVNHPDAGRGIEDIDWNDPMFKNTARGEGGENVE